MVDRSEKAVERTDMLYGLGLLLITILSRIPFRSQILYHWDSVNFAFAMGEFDVAAEQPHPPGYIAYVWLCRLVDLSFDDPQMTMVWLSIVASGLAVVAIYLLGRAMFGRRTGLVAALFLGSSPLFWFYGEIALPHTVDTFFVVLSAWLLYEVLQGRVWAVIAAAVSLAVAGGIRQQTPVFLALLALFAGVRFLQRVGWQRGWYWGGGAVVIFGLLCAAWFFPLIGSAGGLTHYLEVMGAFSERFDTTTSVFLGGGTWGLSRNLRKLGMYTLYGWSVGALPLAAYGVMQLRRRKLDIQWEKILFLLAWVFPSLFFYTLIHMGQEGLVFVFLPVLLLVGARGLVRLAEGRDQRAWVVGLILLIVLNATVFVALPEYPLGGERFKILSWATLRNNDAYYGSRFDAIGEHCPVESTVIVAIRWRHVQWYLPEYIYLPFGVVGKWEKGAGEPLAGGVAIGEFGAADLGMAGEMTVILFDPGLEIFNRAVERESTFALDSGERMTYLRLGAGERLRVSPEGIEVES